MVQQAQEECRILMVENDDGLREEVARDLSALGHAVVAVNDPDEALVRGDLDQFDLIVSDLTSRESDTHWVSDSQRQRLSVTVGSAYGEPGREVVKAFKLGVTSSRGALRILELRQIIEQTLSCKLRSIDVAQAPERFHEKIDFEVPSDLSLMTSVLQYLVERVAKLGLIQPERSNLFVALDEAFVNAVKHGNRNDPRKLLRLTAELSAKEAIFTVEDEGDGFDVREIPDPRDPANLFKTSGRGVMLMYNIMDEVEYNAQGNRVKMVKRPEG